MMGNSPNLRTLEQAIVDTVREPLIVLDPELRVVIASRSYYLTFLESPEQVEGRKLEELGSGQWNIPALRTLLSDILPHHTTVDEYEVVHDFPGLGRRTMLLNARKVFYEGNSSTNVLLAIEDVTQRRSLERDKDELLRQKDLLIREMNHRVNNSLQIIASILMLKAQTVPSEETRRHLREAHDRVLAVATVQEHLNPTPFGEQIHVGRYLTRLCDSLSDSMIREDQSISLSVQAGEGAMNSEGAVSMGLITAELVINALKHAFPDGREGKVIVRYETSATNWRLSVSDNGVGISAHLDDAPVRSGLGTSIVDALTRQFGGRVAFSAGSPGTTVTVTVPRPT
jgi:two-component sensor histidine kinase